MPQAKIQFTEHSEVNPQFLPGSDTDEATQTVWITELHLMNNTSTTRTVTVKDKQGTPVPLLKDIAIDPGSEFHRKYTGMKMEGGFTWSASAADAIAVRCRYSR